MNPIRKTLFVSLLITLFSLNLKADHLIGGEISWVCLNDGRFVFNLTIYRSCNSATRFDFFNINMGLRHTATNAINFPKDNNGQNITGITMLPDINRWGSNQYGYLAPECSNGNPLSCIGGDKTIQIFYYSSLPMNINGIPPASGWHFYVYQCCSSNSDNLNNGASSFMVLESIMYPVPIPNTNPQQFYTTNNCQDRSPTLAQKPLTHFCRGTNYQFNNFSIDDANDSLSYHFTDILTGVYPNIQSAQFKTGYSTQFPFPNYTTDTLNAPIYLNPKSGNLSFGVHTGSSSKIYRYSIGIDSYRNGAKISTVKRELPLYIFDCQNLQGTGPNHSPTLLASGTIADTFLFHVNAGQMLNKSLVVMDNDLDLSRNPPFQNVLVLPFGNQFSSNFITTSFCNSPPCATLSPPPNYNNSKNRYQITGQNSVGMQLNWQTSVNHLDPQGNAKDYYFHFFMQDDQCQIPGQSNATIRVRVHPITVKLNEQITNSNKIEIYPNPSNGNVNLRFPKAGKYQISVIDLTGKLVKQERVPGKQNHSLFLEHSGVYILQVIDELGKQQMKKIVVR